MRPPTYLPDMPTTSGNRVLYFAFGANLLIAGSKFVAAYFTGSSSILSEGIHSLVDTADQLLLFWGNRRSRKPPDETHPFGHGMEIYFWSLIVAILIFSAGGGMSIYEGILHLRHPVPMEHAAWNFAVLAFAFLSEGASFRVALKEFQSKRGRRGIWEAYHGSKNPTVFVVLAEDSAALLGLIVASVSIFLGYRLRMPILDGIGSLIIGLLLCLVAALLAYESRALLLGESVRPEVLRGIRRIALEEKGVQAIGRPLTMHFGPEQVLLNLEVKFRSDLRVKDIVAIIEHLERRIREAFPEIGRIYIESSSLKTVTPEMNPEGP